MNNDIHTVTQPPGADIEHEVQRRVASALETLPELLERATERGVERALRNKETQAEWYREFERHASNNLAQAIGRRVILFVVTAAVGMALAWSWITGRPSA